TTTRRWATPTRRRSSRPSNRYATTCPRSAVTTLARAAAARSSNTATASWPEGAAMLHDAGRTEFDHAVVMVRDRLDELAPHYERQGFLLSDKSVHNLGSCNRLVVLDSTYIELLGWPPGAPPARKEIADSPLVLEVLVSRT